MGPSAPTTDCGSLQALAKRTGEEVRIFLLAVVGQQTPNGYYNLERMLSSTIYHGVQTGICGTCMDARAIRDEELVEGAHRSTLEELTDWTLWADKVITF